PAGSPSLSQFRLFASTHGWDTLSSIVLPAARQASKNKINPCLRRVNVTGAWRSDNWRCGTPCPFMPPSPATRQRATSAPAGLWSPSSSRGQGPCDGIGLGDERVDTDDKGRRSRSLPTCVGGGGPEQAPLTRPSASPREQVAEEHPRLGVR